MPYTTWGVKSGGCGHRHETAHSAQACVASHARYYDEPSDRDLYRVGRSESLEALGIDGLGPGKLVSIEEARRDERGLGPITLAIKWDVAWNDIACGLVITGRAACAETGEPVEYSHLASIYEMNQVVKTQGIRPSEFMTLIELRIERLMLASCYAIREQSQPPITEEATIA